MSSNLPISIMYKQINRSADSGIAGYQLKKKYVDPLKEIQQRLYAKGEKSQKPKKYQTKRGNYLDDASNLHKHCPGPGTYKNQPLWSQKQQIKRNIADRTTYIDEIVKSQKRNKVPAPGSYNIVKTIKQMQKQKKILAMNKIKPSQRINYLDQVQFQATQTPGVGNYNPKVRAKTQTSISKMQKKPQQWIKIHKQKNSKKPEKQPNMRTYNPQPSSYEIFESVTKKKLNKNFLGSVDRFKTKGIGSALSPMKYSVLQNWRGKQAAKTKPGRHGLQVVTKGHSKSVYYH